MLPPSQMAYQQQRALPNLYRDAQTILPHEDLERYKAGGFHPVNLGDTFRDGRYAIRHKLAYGGFSTVWLARDQETQYVTFRRNFCVSSGSRYKTSLTLYISRR